MTPLSAPEGLKLAPQELRVFNALQDWVDERALRAVINDPDGTPRWTPAKIIVSKLKAKIAPHGLTVESQGKPGPHGKRRWRVVRIETEADAA